MQANISNNPFRKSFFYVARLYFVQQYIQILSNSLMNLQTVVRRIQLLSPFIAKSQLFCKTKFLRDFFYQTIRSAQFYFKAKETSSVLDHLSKTLRCTITLLKSDLALDEKKQIQFQRKVLCHFNASRSPWFSKLLRQNCPGKRLKRNLKFAKILFCKIFLLNLYSKSILCFDPNSLFSPVI